MTVPMTTEAESEGVGSGSDFSGTDSGAGTRSDEHGKSSEVASGSVKTAGAWCQDD